MPKGYATPEDFLFAMCGPHDGSPTGRRENVTVIHDFGLALYKTIAALLLPPGIVVMLLVFLGFRAFRFPQRRGLGTALIALAIMLYGTSTTPGSRLLLGSLETPWHTVSPVPDRRWGVVVLSGGAFFGSDGQTELNSHSLERLIGGWEVARSGKWPMVVSGGPSWENPEAPSLGALMETRLRQWGYEGEVFREERARNTWENLVETARIAASQDFEGIVLVTDAFHMTRSVAMAQRVCDLPIHPYPVGFLVDRRSLFWQDFVPSFDELRKSWIGLRERFGILAYDIYGAFRPKDSIAPDKAAPVP